MWHEKMIPDNYVMHNVFKQTAIRWQFKEFSCCSQVFCHLADRDCQNVGFTDRGLRGQRRRRSHFSKSLKYMEIVTAQ